MEHELPVYTFSKIGDNEEIEISLGQDAELNIQDILRTFKGFLIASGFDLIEKSGKSELIQNEKFKIALFFIDEWRRDGIQTRIRLRLSYFSFLVNLLR